MMEDCWLENEEFNFDIPLSPLPGDNLDEEKEENKDEKDEYDDEVFFGPVGHLERCAVAVVKKETVEPRKPWEPEEQESVKISSMLKHKPLSTLQCRSPVAVVFPFKRESPSIDMKSLMSIRDKIANKENIRHGDSKNEEKSQLNMETNEDVTVTKKEASVAEVKVETSTNKKGKMPAPRSETKKVVRRLSVEKPDSRRNNSMIAVPVASGIPKMPSKIARLSSIPSLKPGLLLAKPRQLSSSSKETTLKPMKATHFEAKNFSEKSKPSEMQIATERRTSSKSFATPTKNSDVKHKRSSTGDQQLRRKSMNLNSSMSKLQFSKPNHVSTPIRQLTGKNSSARRSLGQGIPTSSRISSTSSPLKNVTEKHSTSVVGKKALGTSKNRPVSRGNMPSKLMKSSQNETPLKSRNNQRRGSLLRYPSNNGSLPSPISKVKKHPSISNTNMERSGTFVLGESSSPNQTAKDDISLINVDKETKESGIVPPSADLIPVAIANRIREPFGGLVKEKTSTGKSMAECSSTAVADCLNEDIKSEENMIDILVPEVPTTQRSPLLKFDSPAPENIVIDPFATGNTPPAVPVKDIILAPEQIEANLIQF